MERILRVWFEDGRIFIETDKNNVLSRPLEAFPALMEAPDDIRQQYEICTDGDDLRWDALDEDIHISSFYEIVEPDYDNVIGRIFNRFPQLNESEFARYIGINKSLLSRYIYGIKKPSQQRQDQILAAIGRLGREMAEVSESLK